MQVISMLAVAVVLVTTFPAMAIDAAGEVEIPVDLVQAPTVASTSSTVAFAAAPVTLPTVTPIHTVPGCLPLPLTTACALPADADGPFALITDTNTGYLMRMAGNQTGSFTVTLFIPFGVVGSAALDQRRFTNTGGSFSMDVLDVGTGSIIQHVNFGFASELNFTLTTGSRCAAINVGGAVTGSWRTEATYVNSPGDVFSAPTVNWELRSESRELIAIVGSLEITPAFPDESTLPIEGHIGPFTGFTNPAVPGGQNIVAAADVEDRCLHEFGRLTTYADVPLKLEFKFAAQSGGHTHAQGEVFAYPFAVKEVQQVNTPISLDANLTATGRTEVTFPNLMRVKVVAGEASGEVVTYANEGTVSHLFGGKAAEGKVSFRVRVPGLVDLPRSTGPFVYDLGGNRYQPPVGNDGFNHDENHFVNPGLVPLITALGTSLTTILPCCVMIVDDATLPDGGMFDLKGNFDPLAGGHVTHRSGVDFDVQSRLRSRFNLSLTTSDKERVLRGLTPFVMLQGGHFAPESTIHVRFQ